MLNSRERLLLSNLRKLLFKIGKTVKLSKNAFITMLQACNYNLFLIKKEHHLFGALFLCTLEYGLPDDPYLLC